MEDYNDNIPDENIKIVSPKKYSFLLNNMNMFIKSEKKIGNFEKFMRNKNKNVNKDNTKDKVDNSSEESDNLKTIIKEPGILTSNILIDIKKLIKSKNEKSPKNIFNNNNNFNKIKKNVKVCLYRNSKKKENVINNNKSVNRNKLCNTNLNSKSNNMKNRANKRKINSKNNIIKRDNNLTQTEISKNKNFDIYKNKKIFCTNIKINTKKNISDNKEIKNKIFFKKINKENTMKNITKKNALSNDKKEAQKENENQNKGIITKKISFKIKPIEKNKYIEEQNKIYMSQQNLISNISQKNENLNYTDISSNIINTTNNRHISKSNKNLSENKHKYKGRIYHIDYSNNKKRDLTNMIIGLNIIKEIIHKKIKNNFFKLKKNCIYKRKIINMSPKIKKYSKDLTYKIKEENNYFNSINYTEYTYGSNRKSFQALPKFNDLFEKNNSNKNKVDNDIREFRKMIEKKAKTNFLNNKKNRVLLLNPNNYINNCNINSIEINLFKNDYIKDLKETNCNNDNIIIKNIPK